MWNIWIFRICLVYFGLFCKIHQILQNKNCKSFPLQDMSPNLQIKWQSNYVIALKGLLTSVTVIIIIIVLLQFTVTPNKCYYIDIGLIYPFPHSLWLLIKWQMSWPGQEIHHCIDPKIETEKSKFSKYDRETIVLVTTVPHFWFIIPQNSP